MTNVSKAVQIQNQINDQIDMFGSADYQLIKDLDRLIDNFSGVEDDEFIKLMYV